MYRRNEEGRGKTTFGSGGHTFIHRGALALKAENTCSVEREALSELTVGLTYRHHTDGGQHNLSVEVSFQGHIFVIYLFCHWKKGFFGEMIHKEIIYSIYIE